jgi:hypothetical protein
MSAEGLEPSTNGLKGQSSQLFSPVQEPAHFDPVHWMDHAESLLDAVFKGLSTIKRPMDLLHNDHICQQIHMF